jgi:hypothetical protein
VAIVTALVVSTLATLLATVWTFLAIRRAIGGGAATGDGEGEA